MWPCRSRRVSVFRDEEETCLQTSSADDAVKDDECISRGASPLLVILGRLAAFTYRVREKDCGPIIGQTCSAVDRRTIPDLAIVTHVLLNSTAERSLDVDSMSTV